MSEPFIFGENCDPIEVNPFSPICSHPDVGGTSPLSLDVPVPVFAPAIPPNECACFTFTPKEKATVVVKDCSRLDPPKCKVEIEQEDPADCCKGRYKVTPTVEVPCIPFTIDSPVVTVKGRSGGTPDGSVDVTIKPDCCTVKTKVDVKMPDCVKYYDPAALPDVQIKYWDRGVEKTHKLVSMVENASKCSIYPKITPLPIPPCTLLDSADLVHKTVQTSTDGSKIKLTLTRTNCNIGFNVDYTPGTPPVIPLPCYPIIEGYPLAFQIKYKTDEGTEKLYPEQPWDPKEAGFIPAITVTRVPETGGCPKWVFSGGTIDMTGVNLGNGISNGGDVNKTQEGDLVKLRIDGESDGSKTTYWGGGYGDRSTNAGYTTTYSRGPLMRNGYESPEGCVNKKVPVAKVGSAFVIGDYYINPDGSIREAGATGNSTRWQSGRKSIDSKGTYTWSSTANLNVTCPTGAQWHSRGVALTLTTFEFSDAGILSWAQENGEGLLMSPAPAVNEKTGANASGLDIYTDTTNGVTNGLFVDAGVGLRVYGHGKTASTETEATKMGKLEVYKLDSDFAFMTGTNIDRLAINDKAETEKKIMGSSWECTDGARGSNELVIPLMTHFPVDALFYQQDGKWWFNYDELAKEGGTGGWDLVSFFQGIRLVFMHISKSGVVLSIDDNPSESIATRNITS